MVLSVASARSQERWQALRQAGQLLRRVHEAGYTWKNHSFDGWGVRAETGAVVLTSVDGLQRKKDSPERLARKSLSRLIRATVPNLSAGDKLRFFLGYHSLDGLNQQTHEFARRLAVQDRRPQLA